MHQANKYELSIWTQSQPQETVSSSDEVSITYQEKTQYTESKYQLNNYQQYQTIPNRGKHNEHKEEPSPAVPTQQIPGQDNKINQQQPTQVNK